MDRIIKKQWFIAMGLCLIVLTGITFYSLEGKADAVRRASKAEARAAKAEGDLGDARDEAVANQRHTDAALARINELNTAVDNAEARAKAWEHDFGVAAECIMEFQAVGEAWYDDRIDAAGFESIINAGITSCADGTRNLTVAGSQNT